MNREDNPAVERTFTGTLAGLLAAACASVLCAALPARAAMVTIVGERFNLTYDTTRLGAYTAPTLSGNTVFFTSNNLVAEAFAGTDSATSLIDGLVLTLHTGQRIDGIEMAVLGDYLLEGSGSSVSVTGALVARDAFNPGSTVTSGLLLVDPGTPLGLQDGVNRDWSASAQIDAGTAVAPGMSNVFAAGSGSIAINVSTHLGAAVAPASPGFNQAFIEQKFAGLQITVRPVNVVPTPATAALLALALGAMALMGRFRPPAHAPKRLQARVPVSRRADKVHAIG